MDEPTPAFIVVLTYALVLPMAAVALAGQAALSMRLVREAIVWLRAEPAATRSVSEARPMATAAVTLAVVQVFVLAWCLVWVAHARGSDVYPWLALVWLCGGAFMGAALPSRRGLSPHGLLTGTGGLLEPALVFTVIVWAGRPVDEVAAVLGKVQPWGLAIAAAAFIGFNVFAWASALAGGRSELVVTASWRLSVLNVCCASFFFFGLYGTLPYAEGWGATGALIGLLGLSVLHLVPGARERSAQAQDSRFARVAPRVILAAGLTVVAAGLSVLFTHGSILYWLVVVPVVAAYVTYGMLPSPDGAWFARGRTEA
jgi:hypothetical protein